MSFKDEVVGLKSPDQARLRPAPTNLEGDGTLQDAVRDLITTYHDLNPSTIDILHSDPSPLEFMRYIARNRPFVIHNGAKDWPARKSWNSTHLTNIMGTNPVTVALTPHGNADSILSLPSDGSLFIKPHERDEPFSTALAHIRAQELSPSSNSPGLTRYLQTQNDNLRNEYTTLFADVPASIPFARIALEKDPDAVNFWLGNSKSVTALHKDNYENVYVQVLGRKMFVLLPPVEAACVGERGVLAATYAVKKMGVRGDEASGGSGGGGDEGEEELVAVVDDLEEYVPFATWDPDLPDENATPYSHLSRPLRVTLEEGDMLYLPALWYHKVSQSCNDEGICCAVNYWYDLDFSGGFWSTASFVRSVGLVSLQDERDE